MCLRFLHISILAIGSAIVYADTEVRELQWIPVNSGRSGGTNVQWAPVTNKPRPSTEDGSKPPEASAQPARAMPPTPSPKYSPVNSDSRIGGSSVQYVVARQQPAPATSSNSSSEIKDWPIESPPPKTLKLQAPAQSTLPKTAQNPLDWSMMPVCLDARARGYYSPFVCCSLRDGDWFDPAVWDCRRVPQRLDAVFVRHFIRLPDKSVSNSPETTQSQVNIRALWLVESIDPDFSSNKGVLRGGTFFDICQTSSDNSNYVPYGKAAAIQYAFRHHTNAQTIKDLCQSFMGGAAISESDFKIRDPLIIKIAEITGPVESQEVLNIAMTALLPLPVKSPFPAGDRAENPLDELKARMRMEKERLSEPKQPPNDLNVEDKETALDIKRVETELEKKQRAAQILSQLETARAGLQAVAGVSSGRGESRLPPAEDEEVAVTAAPLPLAEIPLYLLNRLEGEASVDNVPIRGLQSANDRNAPKHDGPRQVITHDEFQRQGYIMPSGDLPDFQLTGPSTLRVEAGASLLLLSQVSVDTSSGIRNKGTVFIGDVVIPECLENNSQTGLCRLPSLNSGGYILASNPMTVMWLQLAEPSQDLKPRQLWKGILEYGTDLPDSERSVLTFWGQIEVEAISPGFSLSFKRMAFPPRLSSADSDVHQKATVRVISEKDTSDLLIYMDIFDTDGLINCCADNFESSNAEFELIGANLKLFRYQSFFKDIGDPNRDISEQIVIRAPRIITDQMFYGLEEFIPDSDAVVTNTELPYKLAGINRDIIYFQCSVACQITNQSFLREKPYAVVQVKRALPKSRHSRRLETLVSEWESLGASDSEDET